LFCGFNGFAMTKQRWRRDGKQILREVGKIFEKSAGGWWMAAGGLEVGLASRLFSMVCGGVKNPPGKVAGLGLGWIYSQF